jgi:hypothetical protein
MIVNKTWIISALSFLMLFSCRAQKPPVMQEVVDHAIAFPGAEGFGKYATGGRGGVTLIVTNLDDKGPGSFREAAERKGKRIIVFAVSGTIHLESRLNISGHVTIAGQTAPGDGICIADQPVGLNGDNIIIRYMRFRMGDKYQRQAGMVDGSGGDDALGGTRRKHIIIDHCSISWSTDECFTIYGGDSTTLQWNIISEPLNYSYHFETGDKDFERHGFGGIWGGAHLSAHHNLFAHCVSRNPRFNGTRLGAQQEFVDYRNNVIYNWGNNNVYGGEGGNYNVVNNYYKYGPSTNGNVRFRIVNPSRQVSPAIGYGKFFVEGNHVDGANDISSNNLFGVHIGNGGTEEDKKEVVVNKAFNSDEIFTHPAEEAFKLVMAKGGCSLPARDTLDDRIIRNVKERTGAIIDVQGGLPHGTPFEKTIHAWPHLGSKPAPADADADGIPDAWEIKNGLDPKDPSDGNRSNKGNVFTNIELYINELTK